MGGRRMLRWTAAGCLLAAIGCTTAVPAGAATGRAAGGATCTGTAATPGHLAGTYPTGVVVKGYCQVDGGAAVVDGTLVLAAHATLVASFAHNDVTGTGSSSLSVTGDVKVGNGATFFVGCEPGYFACSDDPGGTLYGSDHISGNLVAKHALGVVVHASSIGGSVTQSSGGGGVNCNAPASGPFVGWGDYSDYEDDSIGGNLHVTGLRTCWVGMLRNTVPGNLVDSGNSFADPDANEVMQNTVGKNITCTGNSPAVQYGDSGATPNVVTGKAFGECAFTLASGTPVSVKA
jgi:hypothetical protein